MSCSEKIYAKLDEFFSKFKIFFCRLTNCIDYYMNNILSASFKNALTSVIYLKMNIATGGDSVLIFFYRQKKNLTSCQGHENRRLYREDIDLYTFEWGQEGLNAHLHRAVFQDSNGKIW